VSLLINLPSRLKDLISLLSNQLLTTISLQDSLYLLKNKQIFIMRQMLQVMLSKTLHQAAIFK
jgi:hypothetical protein